MMQPSAGKLLLTSPGPCWVTLELPRPATEEEEGRQAGLLPATPASPAVERRLEAAGAYPPLAVLVRGESLLADLCLQLDVCLHMDTEECGSAEKQGGEGPCRTAAFC